MNYCRKCQSDYEKPGTCNCFAPLHVGAPRDCVPVAVPYCPPYQPWWIYPTYPAITWGTSGSTVLATADGASPLNVTSNSVSIEQAMKASAGFSFTAD